MFGFIKNLMGERGPESAPPAPEELPPPILPSGSAAARTAETATAASPVPASPATAGVRPPTDGLHIKSSVTHSGRVVLSFKAITDKFPATLRATLATSPDAATLIALKLDDILPQLSTGRVEVPLADLRRMAPLGSFVDDTSRDAEKVSIPLDELLPKLDSTLLQTTKARERIEVPSDIATPFRKQGEAPKEESPPHPQRQLAPGIQAPSEIQALFAKSGKTEPERRPAPEPVRPLPVAPPPAPEPQAPAAPSPADSAVVPSPIKLSLRPSASQTISGPIPTPSPASAAPASVPLSIPSPAMPPPVSPPEKEAPPSLSRPPASIFSRRPIVDAPAPITSRLAGAKSSSITTSRLSASGPIRQPAPISMSEPTGSQETISIPLAAVSKQWPEAIRDEIASSDPSAAIAFPKAELESALKQGKVAIRWARLRGWVTATQGLPAVSLYDEAMVELPLPVVAPLFMAAAKPSAAARRVTVDESMPALFQPAGAAAAPPSTSADTAPPPLSAAAAAPAIRGAGATAPGVEGRQPSILVDRACALRGVAGAVIALADGLLVAASVPKEFTAETIAAFLPQVFSRLEQAAGSMKIGEVQHLSFIAGERTWQIWRAGDLFFAAIGTPNEMLPGAQLKILAAQLARQTRG